jgi:hypothetical protein
MYDRVLVRFTGNISFPTSGNYQFYSPADDGTMLFIDGVQVADDWRDKGGGGSTSAPVYFEGGSTHSITLYFYENGGGAAVWLYYYTPQTGYQLVPAAYLGTTATTTTTYVEQITWTQETYYTTEIVPGQVHPLINDPSLLPALQEAQANQQAALATFNEADQTWKEAQAAQQTAAQNSTASYLQVIETATSLNSASLELDVEQTQFNQVQSSYNQALQIKQEAQQDLTNKQSTLDEDLIKLQTSKNSLSTETRKSQELLTSNEAAEQDLTAKQAAQTTAQDLYDQSVTKLLSSTSDEASAKEQRDVADGIHAASQDETFAATSNKTAAEQELAQAEAAATTSNEEAVVASRISFSRAQELLTQEPPKPEPEPEEGSAESPAVIEDLMQVDLQAVDPTELTPEQATQLVEAALVAFETAVEGSPEYEQALDALYLAAEQDDLELSPELAAIPGLAGAVEVLNFLGNAGADMSPKVREESEKVVVATVVAAGAAIQSAAAAAATASAPSGGSRRIGK